MNFLKRLWQYFFGTIPREDFRHYYNKSIVYKDVHVAIRLIWKDNKICYLELSSLGDKYTSTLMDVDRYDTLEINLEPEYTRLVIHKRGTTSDALVYFDDFVKYLEIQDNRRNQNSDFDIKSLADKDQHFLRAAHNLYHNYDHYNKRH